jgi:hypothetical protein
VVDQLGNFVRTAAVGVQPETGRARRQHAAHFTGTAIRRKAMAGASSRRDDSRCDELLEDDLDDPANIRQANRFYLVRSRFLILASRRIYRASRIGVDSHVSTMPTASSRVSSVAPSVSTLAPLCSRA